MQILPQLKLIYHTVTSCKLSHIRTNVHSVSTVDLKFLHCSFFTKKSNPQNAVNRYPDQRVTHYSPVLLYGTEVIAPIAAQTAHSPVPQTSQIALVLESGISSVAQAALVTAFCCRPEEART